MWESSSLGVSLQASGLQYCDVREGTGEEPFKGQTIKCVSSVFVRFRGWEKGSAVLKLRGLLERARAHYTGKLASNGRKFDSSYDRGSPLQFKVVHRLLARRTSSTPRAVSEPKRVAYQVGAGAVIKGWDDGILGAEVRTLPDIQPKRAPLRVLGGDRRLVVGGHAGDPTDEGGRGAKAHHPV